MTREEIDDLRNFSLSEKDVFGRHIFEQYEEIDSGFMNEVDRFVKWVKEKYGAWAGRMIVHDIVNGEHTLQSYHYQGRAIDFHFPGLTIAQTGVVCLRWGWGGIGLYEQWHTPGAHIDNRNERGTKYTTRQGSQWTRYDGEYNYDFQIFEKIITGGDNA